MSVHTSVGPDSPAASDEKGAARAAQQLEAFFLRRMLAEVRPDGGGMLDGGFAGGTFREMLDEALADKMAASGGVGLAQLFERELDATAPRAGTSHSSATPTPRPATAALSVYRASASETAPPATLRSAPLEGRTTSRFGHRVDPIEGDERVHAGIDLAAPAGTPVRAVESGVVVRSGAAGGYGNLVVVDHGGGLQTRYGHLSRTDVKPGDRVAAGTPLGAVGQTGRATGPHLHLEVRRNGEAVDPEKVIEPLKAAETRPNRLGGGR